jgi:Predicted ATPase (AAA+ superfamily)
MYIKRELAGALATMAQQFPVVAVMGPRQSGKTTLARQTFPDYAYVSLEDLDRRAFAQNDPRGFFASYASASGLIIDEIQNVPDLFSYMQRIVDEQYRPGYYIVTGSQHFLMHEKISQTLAGRVALLTLLPLSVNELRDAGLLAGSATEQLLKGFYPRPYVQPVDRAIWCANYISTYIEKDVRQVLQITDVVSFQRFLKLCAARVGNVINYADLARDADISPNTAKAWLSILEASYVIKFLYPYYRNFNKRVIKSPKLYFYDTALVCSLLGITSEQDLQMHPFRGALFESFAIAELYKYFLIKTKCHRCFIGGMCKGMRSM